MPKFIAELFSSCRVFLLVLLAAFFCTQPVQAEPRHHRPLGESNLIARVPFPGYPEAVVVHQGRFYVSTPATFGVPGNFVPSEIFVYDLHTGKLVNAIAIQNQPAGLHGISCMAFGDDDDLYVLDEQLGVVRIDVKTNTQTVYAAPFYPVFTSAYNPPAPVLVNDLAFDPQGNLYITDSFQATIWRVPTGGGAPQIWYQSSLIDGPFGPNGIRIDPRGRQLYFDVTFTATGEGVIYTLPLVDHPTDSDLKAFHTYPVGSGPDGFAFGRSGKLYVCLAAANQISVLSPDGREIGRFSSPAKDSVNPAQPLAWANPANIAFDDCERRILVTNHASLIQVPDPSIYFAVFDVFVDDTAGRTFGECER